MLSKETKKRIDDARNVLVGVLPLPSDQIELITVALIYKFMDDQDEELRSIGQEPIFFIKELKAFSWQQLMSNQLSADQRVTKFINGIEAIQKSKSVPQLFREIFTNTFLKFRDGRVLQLFLDTINGFSYDHSEELGNAFEYLLMTMGAQGDNGQFRTPRNIIDFLVEVVDPNKNDSILDPAAGTGGFLVSAFKHIMRKNTTGYENYRISLQNYEIEGVPINWGDKLSSTERNKIGNNIEGYDNTPLMVRLARVNLYLHQFTNPKIHEYDTLTYNTRWKEKYDCILANPPFMTPKGGIETHDKFRIRANRTEILFADYILEHLTPNGKAGFVVPEGIIFQASGDFTDLRKWLLYEAGLWAVVSLPANIFQPYSGVKTSILFIDREIARQRKEVLLVKIENDGFSLNTNRTAINENDLPDALNWMQLCKTDLEKFRKDLKGNENKFTKKLCLLHREEFAKLDIYQSTSTTFNFCKKQFERISIIIQEINAQITTEKLKLKKEKKKDKIKKIKDNIESLKIKVKKNSDDFHKKTGADFLPKTEELLREWFDKNVKDTVIQYGVKLEEAPLLVKSLKDVLDSQREYNLNIDKYSKKITELTTTFPLIEIGEICDLINGRAFKPGDWETKNNGGLPIIRIQNLNNNQAGFNYYSQKVDERHIVNNGDLLFSWSGSKGTSFGAFIWQGGKAVLNQHIFNVKHNDLVDRQYLHYALNKAVEQVEENLHGGVGLVHITKGNLEKIPIPVPPIEIQRTLIKEIEDYQKVINGTDFVLKNYIPSFEIDPVWPFKSLAEVCEKITDGTHHKPNYTSRGYKFLSAKNVTKKVIDWERIKYIDAKQHKELSKRVKPKRNDILLAKNGTTGVAAINDTDEEFDIYVSLALLRPSKLIDPYYLLYVVNSEIVKKQFNERLKGVGVPNLHLKEINEVSIPLPPIKIQKGIVDLMKDKWLYLKKTEIIKQEYQNKINSIINRIWTE